MYLAVATEPMVVILVDKQPSFSWPKGRLIISVVVLDGSALPCRVSMVSVITLDNS